MYSFQITEAGNRVISTKKVFLKNAGLQLYQKTDSLNFSKFSITPFFTQFVWWLLLTLSTRKGLLLNCYVSLKDFKLI